MATIRVTMLKAGRSNEYGQPLLVGTTYTLDYTLGASLVYDLFASDTDRVLPGSANLPFAQSPYAAGAGQLTATQGAEVATSEAILSPGDPLSINASFKNGITPWAKLFGPNELAAWSKSAELATTAKYVTAQQAANGPAMFRREGASIYVDGALMSANFGNIRTFTAGVSSGLPSTTLALLVYWHRLNANSTIKLRLGADSGNYVVYSWRADANMLIEGWNILLVSTAESIGTSVGGQNDINTGSSTQLGWQVGAGTYAFGTAIGYAAIDIEGTQAGGGQLHNSHVWVEGVYSGGKDKARLTIGFDIQGAGLDLAKTSMDMYGFKGYAAVPTANGNSATPEYVWSVADAVRLQGLYAANWDIIQHGVSHNPLGNYSDDSMIIGEIEGCREQIVQLASPRGKNLFATPNASSSNRVIAIAKRAGVKWIRTTAPVLVGAGLTGVGNSLMQGCTSVANKTDISWFQKFVDLLILYGAAGHVYTHGVISGASDSLNTNVTVFQAMLAYAKTKVDAGQLEVLTPSLLLTALGMENIPSMTVPNRVAITLGVSPYDLYNTSFDPVVFVVSAGTVTSITYSRDGSTFDATGQIAGQFLVQPGDRLRITYAVAPTVIQYRSNSL